MDLNTKRLRKLCLTSMLVFSTGCVAPKTPVPTFWQKLGMPQTGARLRDGLINRRGNFPGLEKKPPVLALADPANLEAGKPEMIKAAAEIKQDQDLKKQKIKAIKFLGEVNCGCYNEDDKVVAAFMAALEDCDPDVRSAALTALCTTASGCTKCSAGCGPNCLSKEILEKLEDMAHGCVDGCFKEPEADLRQAAKGLLTQCPPLPEDPIEPEELIAPEAEPLQEKKPLIEGSGAVTTSSFRMDDSSVSYTSSRRVRQQPSGGVSYGISDKLTSDAVSNSENLVQSTAVAYKRGLGELLVHMSDSFELDTGWTAVVVDARGQHSLAKIIDVGGRRLLLAIDSPESISIRAGESVGLGLVSK